MLPKFRLPSPLPRGMNLIGSGKFYQDIALPRKLCFCANHLLVKGNQLL